MDRWLGGVMDPIGVGVRTRATVPHVFPEKPFHETRQRHNTIKEYP